MESFVSIVTTGNYENYIADDTTKFKVLLFTNKKATPPLFKALSKEYKGKLLFGQIKSSDEQLIEKFKITNYPTLMVLTDPSNYQGTVFEEKSFKKDRIKKFLRDFAYGQKKNPKGEPL